MKENNGVRSTKKEKDQITMIKFFNLNYENIVNCAI